MLLSACFRRGVFRNSELQKQRVPAKWCVILHTFAFFFFLFFFKLETLFSRKHFRLTIEVTRGAFWRDTSLSSASHVHSQTDPPALSPDHTERGARLKVLWKLFFFFSFLEAFILLICRQNSRIMALHSSCGVNQYSTCADLPVRICHIHKRNLEWNSVVKKSAFIKSSRCWNVCGTCD